MHLDSEFSIYKEYEEAAGHLMGIRGQCYSPGGAREPPERSPHEELVHCWDPYILDWLLLKHLSLWRKFRGPLSSYRTGQSDSWAWDPEF